MDGVAVENVSETKTPVVGYFAGITKKTIPIGHVISFSVWQNGHFAVALSFRIGTASNDLGSLMTLNLFVQFMQL